MVPALLLSFGLLFAGIVVFGQSSSVSDAPPPPPAEQEPPPVAEAAAAIAGGYVSTELPHFVKDIADTILGALDIKNTGNTWQRFVLAAVIVVLFYLLRQIGRAHV